MARKKTFSSILLMATSFIGGVAAGLLLAPEKGKRSRLWLSERADDLSDWIAHRGKTARIKGKKELHKLRRNVQQGIRQNVPDPYEATEEIALGKDQPGGA